MSSIISDNGSNFVGAENMLKELNWEKITKECLLKKITWRFNPPAAPWFGGFFERLVGLVKDLLKKNLGNSKLNREQLDTLIVECEDIINQRPLTYLGENDNIIALTPAMFINNVFEFRKNDLNLINEKSARQCYRSAQNIREQFTNRFKTEYLNLLMECNHPKNVKELKAGDIVLVGTDQQKRIHWPLARVLETYTGVDGVQRVAKVKVLGGGELVRPYRKLYPLELSLSSEDTPEEIKHVDDPEQEDKKQEDMVGMVDGKLSRKGRRIQLPKRFM